MRWGGTVLLIVGLALVAFGGCTQESYPLNLWLLQHQDAAAPTAGALNPEGGSLGDSSPPPPGAMYCSQTHAESLPARLVAMSASAQTGGNVVLVSSLFDRFNQVCNPCHTAATDPPGQGGFQIVRVTDFKSNMTPAVIAHVTGAVCPKNPDPNDQYDPMPPCSNANGATYTSRPPEDSVLQFAELVNAWIRAGSPATEFTPMSAAPASGGDGGDGGGAASQYVMTPQVGNAMTNIGNCIPSPAMVGIEDQKSTALDAMFASAQKQATGTAAQRLGLPSHLGDTDLFTLDSALLAQYRVLAYAPGYPLWSDNAGKLRHVRVPRGQSIRYNSTTQQFDIPPNTRFYKTFLKPIYDTDGSYRFRKIETRLIVSRPDQTSADGTVTPTALFGAYRWNDTETDATLVDTPLNDSTPFADTVLLYNTDEQLAADILKGQPTQPADQLLARGAARHYAIPSSQRCIQCHMGSPSDAFVLGFTPLQINRRPTGSGGTIEATGPDELTQLQRFIDAGIVTGINSPSDLAPLEQSQGNRTPRNEQELVAQGYALGNCTHCHNPRGFPTVQNPVLKDIFDLLPSATGGLFQYPLERYSPRIGRGLTGTTPIPYITPSLLDLPREAPNGDQVADPFINAESQAVSAALLDGGANNNNLVNGYDISFVEYAPWRSIIYRNVDSLFAYVDDNALYPHMPMNTPGFDPRAKQIFGDWMVSIPAVRKHPELVEYSYQIANASTDQVGFVNHIGSFPADSEAQPYVEVLPGQPGYDAAVAAAKKRLDIFHDPAKSPLASVDLHFVDQGGMLPHCAAIHYMRYSDPGQTEDIIDPAVTLDPICHPIPSADLQANCGPLAAHPHWVKTDLTSAPGPWGPREAPWADILIRGKTPNNTAAACGATGGEEAYADQLRAIALAQDAYLSQVDSSTNHNYASTPVPFGLWKKKAGCDFSKQKTVADYAGARPHWMDVTNPPPDVPVYEQTPGAAVFKMICINCHGPNADSNGRLAVNLATMTGGNALVADFKHGLFGPVGAPEETSNRHAVFGDPTNLMGGGSNWKDVSMGGMATDDDRASRYIAWMGLGGTTVIIPAPILEIVAITSVLGEQRIVPADTLSANMLSQAKSICKGLLAPDLNPTADRGVHYIAGSNFLDPNVQLTGRLLTKNGDAEMWQTLCQLHNPPPIRVLTGGVYGNYLVVHDIAFGHGTLVPAATYPDGQPVGNHLGNIVSYDSKSQSELPSNLWPWCVDDDSPDNKPGQKAWIDSNNFPICPPAVKQNAHGCTANPDPATCFDPEAEDKWAVRGAINAGMSVFLYLRSIEDTGPPPDYDQCNLLK
jgi:mono/diheme cytochrome c family protein